MIRDYSTGRLGTPRLWISASLGVAEHDASQPREARSLSLARGRPSRPVPRPWPSDQRGVRRCMSAAHATSAALSTTLTAAARAQHAELRPPCSEPSSIHAPPAAFIRLHPPRSPPVRPPTSAVSQPVTAPRARAPGVASAAGMRRHGRKSCGGCCKKALPRLTRGRHGGGTMAVPAAPRGGELFAAAGSTNGEERRKTSRHGCWQGAGWPQWQRRG